MAVSIPESLQRIFGDAAPDFIAIVRQIAAESQVSREEVERLARERQTSRGSGDARVNARIHELQQEIRRLDRRVHVLNDRLFDQAMENQTRWLVGTIALFGTLITILLAVTQFAP